ncbi:MAG: hypothetical protein PHG03_00575 [Bacilli bacterium]|nr:hypothetical protein [Bacilli bacterium]MDD4795039.1 hypothetical protein [Bacilli bacterium]
MVNELERLLSNSHSPNDTICFSSIVIMKDGSSFGGVTVKNDIYRDAIYAEQVAIARAITAGYKYNDFNEIHIMVSTNNINDLRHINKDMITEHFEPSSEVFLYDKNRNMRVLKAGHLLFNIY